jgi:hypothetical protein
MVSNRFAFVFVLLLFIGLTACNNKREKMLCKRWQVSDVQFINESEAMKQSDTMQGNIQAQMEIVLRDVMMKNIYEFKDDGTYMTGNAAASAKGEWAFSGDNIRFISDQTDGQKTKIVPIEKLQEDTLIVVLKQDQTTIQMKLVLTPLESR